MNKQLIIHAVVEVLVLGVVVFITSKQIRVMKGRIVSLEQQLKQYDDKIDKAIKHINQLYMILDSVGILPGPTQQQQPQYLPTNSAATALTNNSATNPSSSSPSIASTQAPSQAPMMFKNQSMSQYIITNEDVKQQQQPHPQQVKQSKSAPNMMDTILNIIPTMMPMMSMNGPSMIIAELQKQEFAANSSEQKPHLEIVDDDEDPDVLAALQEEDGDQSQSTSLDLASSTLSTTSSTTTALTTTNDEMKHV
jgi:hypothetical protein